MLLDIPASKNMPRVSFDMGVLTLEGRSIPQDSSPFYKPILKSLNDYALSPNDETIINIKIEFLNSDSMRSLMNILIIAEKIFLNGHKVFVKWYYNDTEDVIYDSGTIYKSLLELPIDLIQRTP